MSTRIFCSPAPVLLKIIIFQQKSTLFKKSVQEKFHKKFVERKRKKGLKSTAHKKCGIGLLCGPHIAETVRATTNLLHYMYFRRKIFIGIQLHPNQTYNKIKNIIILSIGSICLALKVFSWHTIRTR